MASSDVTIPLLEKIGRGSVKVNYDTANVEFYSGERRSTTSPRSRAGWPTSTSRTRRAEGELGFRCDRLGCRRLHPRARDPGAVRLYGPVLGRDRVPGRAVAAARGSHGEHAPLARAPERSRSHPGVGSWRTRSTCRRCRIAGEGVPAVSRARDRDRPGRFDGGPRRPRPALDRRLHPARGREAGRAGARCVGRPSDRFGLARTIAAPTASSTSASRRSVRRARRLRDACRRRLQANRAAERPLRELLGAAVRGGTRPTTSSRTTCASTRSPTGKASSRRRPRSTSRHGWDPCQRRRDVRRARDRPRSLRHGAGARLRSRPRRAAHQRVRADRSGVPLDAWIVLVAAGEGREASGASRARRPPRRESSSSSGADGPSSTSYATWTTSTTGSACASDPRSPSSGRASWGPRAYRELQSPRQPRSREAIVSRNSSVLRGWRRPSEPRQRPTSTPSSAIRRSMRSTSAFPRPRTARPPGKRYARGTSSWRSRLP